MSLEDDPSAPQQHVASMHRLFAVQEVIRAIAECLPTKKDEYHFAVTSSFLWVSCVDMLWYAASEEDLRRILPDELLNNQNVIRRGSTNQVAAKALEIGVNSTPADLPVGDRQMDCRSFKQESLQKFLEYTRHIHALHMVLASDNPAHEEVWKAVVFSVLRHMSSPPDVFPALRTLLLSIAGNRKSMEASIFLLSIQPQLEELSISFVDPYMVDDPRVIAAAARVIDSIGLCHLRAFVLQAVDHALMNGMPELQAPLHLFLALHSGIRSLQISEYIDVDLSMVSTLSKLPSLEHLQMCLQPEDGAWDPDGFASLQTLSLSCSSFDAPTSALPALRAVNGPLSSVKLTCTVDQIEDVTNTLANAFGRTIRTVGIQVLDAPAAHPSDVSALPVNAFDGLLECSALTRLKLDLDGSLSLIVDDALLINLAQRCDKLTFFRMGFTALSAPLNITHRALEAFAQSCVELHSLGLPVNMSSHTTASAKPSPSQLKELHLERLSSTPDARQTAELLRTTFPQLKLFYAKTVQHSEILSFMPGVRDDFLAQWWFDRDPKDPLPPAPMTSRGVYAPATFVRNLFVPKWQEQPEQNPSGLDPVPQIHWGGIWPGGTQP